jgi:UDP-galactopyranose mutase
LTANENADLKYTTVSDAKKNKLRKQLDSGFLRPFTQKKWKQIDEDLDNKKSNLNTNRLKAKE